MEELAQAQIEQLQENLLALAEQLHEQLEGTVDQVVSLDQQKIGRVSRIDAIQQNQMDKANQHSARQRLSQVMVALAAIKEDDYGYCISCDEPIGVARLMARPETTLCVQCQAKIEERV